MKTVKGEIPEPTDCVMKNKNLEKGNETMYVHAECCRNRCWILFPSRIRWFVYLRQNTCGHTPKELRSWNCRWANVRVRVAERSWGQERTLGARERLLFMYWRNDNLKHQFRRGNDDISHIPWCWSVSHDPEEWLGWTQTYSQKAESERGKQMAHKGQRQVHNTAFRACLVWGAFGLAVWMSLRMAISL